MPASDTRSDDSFCDTCRNSSLDDSCYGVHGSDNLGLELWRDVEFDLLEEVLGGAEAAHNKNILVR